MTPSPAPEPTTRFPIPWVGTACLLAVLIVLTPVLLTGGAGGGTLLTQANVTIDHPPGTGNTTVLVSAVGAVRYAAIDIGWNWSYPPGAPASALRWDHWSNLTDALGAYASVPHGNIAINVTVEYATPGARAVYYFGILGVAYSVAQGSVQLYALSPGIAVPSAPILVSSPTLPILIPLAYLGGGRGSA
ncbi:MAG: hypothetical protein QXG65_01095 [Thermoplasmata archaeon]